MQLLLRFDAIRSLTLFDFSERANLDDFPEQMDQPCSYEQMRDCLHGIARVNRLTLAYRPTLRWLGLVREAQPLPNPLRIVDVGCGYGDALRRIHHWAAARRLPVELTGIDLNPDAIRAAREATPATTGITFLAGNVYDWHPSEGVDIVLSSLLTHHLRDSEIVDFLAWMEATARVGWFINDLHREPMPYRLFRTLVRFTRWHPFVKHDGPVSILRSFRPEDWRRLCADASIPPDAYELLGYRPARLCVSRIRTAALPTEPLPAEFYDPVSLEG